MTKQTAERVFHIVLGVCFIGGVAFVVWAIYFTLTNPN